MDEVTLVAAGCMPFRSAHLGNRHRVCFAARAYVRDGFYSN